MCTRFLGRSGLLSNVALLAVVSALAAGCSENAARFADPLFTASVPSNPVAVDKFGNPINSTQYNGTSAQTPLPPSLPRSQRISPQRVDVAGQQTRTEDVFTARNITKVAKQRNFRPGHFGPLPQVNEAPVRQPQLASLPAPAAIQRAPLQPVSGQLPPPARAAAPLPSAQSPRDFNDVNEGRLPSLADARIPASIPPAQSLPPVPSATQFPVGTQWTRLYSPVPTRAPRQVARQTAPVDAPRAYTPPTGAYTSDIDRTSTSSISNVVRPQPTVIRASVPASSRSASRVPTSRASNTVDPTTVSSIAAGPASVRDQSGWSTAGGTRITVQNGDTLYSISRRYGVPVDAITRANNLNNPSDVHAGRQLLIPTYVYSPDVKVSAPDSNEKVREFRSNPQPPAAPTTIRADLGEGNSQPLPPVVATSAPSSDVSSHTVKSGDTLSKISRQYNVRLDRLKSANGLGATNVIRVGQVVTIPSASDAVIAQGQAIDYSTTASVSRTTPTRLSQPNLPSEKVQTRASAPSPVRRPNEPSRNVQVARLSVDDLPRLESEVPPVAPYKKPQVQSKEVASLGQPNISPSREMQFDWPVKGEIAVGFGVDGKGNRNDGINVLVPEGTPVRASANGEVIYASDGLSGYGKLVLIRHPNGFVSAYAHNSELKVRRGDRVRQGQVISKSGKTGSVDVPQVHFELRDGKTPVDPLIHLS